MKYLSYNIDITIDNKIDILIKDKKIISEADKIIIEFPVNSLVLDCVPTPEIFSEKVKVAFSIFPLKSSSNQNL